MPTQPTTGQQDFEAVRCLGVPLADQLDAYSRLLQAHQQPVATLYDDLVCRLKSGGAGLTATAVGERIAPFILPDSQGRLVTSDDLLRRGPLVVSFNRGSWCPYCRLELLALADIYSDFKKHGGEIVSIIPERGPSTDHLKDVYDLPFPVLSDIDNAYALANGLMISIGVNLRQVLLEHGVDMARLHGNAGMLVPITATYVIATDGTVLDAFVDADFRKRMPTEQVIAALQDLK